MNKRYWLKNKTNRQIANLLLYSNSITNIVYAIFGNNLVNVNVCQNYFELNLKNNPPKSQLIAMGRKLAKTSLGQYATTYFSKSGRTTQLFIKI